MIQVYSEQDVTVVSNDIGRWRCFEPAMSARLPYLLLLVSKLRIVSSVAVKLKIIHPLPHLPPQVSPSILVS